jgi:hypothetical protein
MNLVVLTVSAPVSCVFVGSVAPSKRVMEAWDLRDEPATERPDYTGSNVYARGYNRKSWAESRRGTLRFGRHVCDEYPIEDVSSALKDK